MPADLARVAELSADVHAACEEARFDEIARMDLDLAVAEAANNIIVHGYDGKAGKHYGVRIEARSGLVEIVLTDRGLPIPADMLSSSDSADDADESGRGLFLIRQCVDELSYSSEGGENKLTLRKCAAL